MLYPNLGSFFSLLGYNKPQENRESENSLLPVAVFAGLWLPKYWWPQGISRLARQRRFFFLKDILRHFSEGQKDTIPMGSLHFKLNHLHNATCNETYCRRVLFILASMPYVGPKPPLRSLACPAQAGYMIDMWSFMVSIMNQGLTVLTAGLQRISSY